MNSIQRQQRRARMWRILFRARSGPLSLTLLTLLTVFSKAVRILITLVPELRSD